MAIVITGLIVSAILSLPLLAEATMLDKWVHHFGLPRSVTAWIEQVHEALHKTYGAYPFVPYGTDWLAFGHFVIAFFVLGAFLDPVRNVWIIRASLIACLPVVPTALIAWRGARSSALVAGHRLFFWHRGFPSPRGCR